jgi:hypothetical protein
MRTIDYFELILAIAGVVYGTWSDLKRRSEREFIHMALVNLKASIQKLQSPGDIAAINNMLEFLKPPK